MGQTVEPKNINPSPKRNRGIGALGPKVSKRSPTGKRTKSMKLGNGTTTGIMTPPATGRNGIGR